MAQQKRKNQKGTTAFYLLLIAIGLVSVFLAFRRDGSDSLGDEFVANLGNQHVDKGQEHQAYNSIPPTSGPHFGSLAEWGVHTEQIPDELQVHNLEDGGVIIHYDPARLDGEILTKLQALVESRGQRHLILEPYTSPSLPSPIVLTAWSHLLKLEAFDEKKIVSFIKKYEGRDHHVRSAP